MFDRRRVPSVTTAIAVSSQDVSMPRMWMAIFMLSGVSFQLSAPRVPQAGALVRIRSHFILWFGHMAVNFTLKKGRCYHRFKARETGYPLD